MLSDKRIQKLIKRILNPNVSATINDYSKYSSRRQYETILSNLCLYAKKCSHKKLYTPHIQLKDDNGSFLYNDTLNIIVPKNREIEPSSKCHFQADFIDDGLRGNSIYGVFSTLELSGKKSLTFGTFELEKPLSEMDLDDYFNLMGCMLHNEEKASETDIPLENQPDGMTWVHALIHIYNPKNKTWSIDLPLKVSFEIKEDDF